MPVWLGPGFGPVFEQMDDYGGWGGASGQDFFYLIVNGRKTPHLSDSDVKSFFRTGVNTSSDFIFVFVDISSDRRLASDLERIEGGAEFYRKIEKMAPVFLITHVSIRHIANAKTIQLLPVRNYDKDVSAIYDRMGVHSPSTRKSAILFLKRVNKYLNLKPNLFGVGANFNDMISDLLDRMERSAP
jgi:hypothetical protein